MKFSIVIPCFFKNISFCDALHRCADLGFDTVETYNWKSLDLDAVHQTLQETGIRLISLCTTEFRLNTPEHRQLWLDGLRESCVAAKKLGVKKLITQVGQDTGGSREEQHTSIVKGLTAGIPILEEYGVTIMIEPLNTYVNHKGYYLWSSAEAFDIIREVNHPQVKMVFDIYHQQIMEGNIIPNVTSNLDCIAHLHAAGHPGRNELQFGENDYRVILAAIEKAGYTGAVGLEYRPLLDPIESLLTARDLYFSDLNPQN